VCMQVLLGFAAWVVSWGLPLGLLPDAIASRIPETSIVVLARSTLSSLVVTGHVVLGMMILGASVVLCILSGGLPNASGSSFVSRQRVIA